MLSSGIVQTFPYVYSSCLRTSDGSNHRLRRGHNYSVVATSSMLRCVVERSTPGEEVPGSIPAVVARSLLVGSVSVYCDQLRQKPWSPSSVSCVAAHKIARRSVLGLVRDITLVVDEDVKKPTNQRCVVVDIHVPGTQIAHIKILYQVQK